MQNQRNRQKNFAPSLNEESGIADSGSSEIEKNQKCGFNWEVVRLVSWLTPAVSSPPLVKPPSLMRCRVVMLRILW